MLQARAAERVGALLRARQVRAWLELALLLVLDAAAAAGFVYAALQGFIVFSALGCTALILLTAREVRRVRATHACLRQLAPRPAVLPRAVVHRR
jgi:membrane protein YdbS with pleckstrin-like domain